MSCSGMTAHCCHEPRHVGNAHQHPPFLSPIDFDHASLCAHISHSGTSAATDPSYFTYLQLRRLPQTSLFSFEEAWVAKCWIPEITWQYTVAPAGVFLARGLKGGDTMLQSLDAGLHHSMTTRSCRYLPVCNLSRCLLVHLVNPVTVAGLVVHVLC